MIKIIKVQQEEVEKKKQFRVRNLAFIIALLIEAAKKLFFVLLISYDY